MPRRLKPEEPSLQTPPDAVFRLVLIAVRKRFVNGRFNVKYESYSTQMQDGFPRVHQNVFLRLSMT